MKYRKVIPLVLVLVGFLAGYGYRQASVSAHPATLPDIAACGSSKQSDLGGYLVCAVNTIYAQQQQMDDIAWAKAGDRIVQWQRDSQAYKDTWFYDQLYLRWRIHECRNGQPIRVPCPATAGGPR
jgi:hypothetical protein